MKALHIISDLTTAGAQTVVMNYLRYFQADLELSIVVAIKGEPMNTPYEEEAKNNGYSVEYCLYRPVKSIPVIRTILNWIREQRLVYKEIKKVKPDVVHTHGTKLIPYTLFPVLLAGIKRRFHTLHSDPYALPSRFVIWSRLAFNLFGVYPVCVTEGQAKKAVQRYHIKKYSIIKNGIDDKRFSNPQCKEDMKRQIGIKESTFVIGCVGRLDKVKNHLFLIDVFSAFLKQHNDAVLILLGDGPELGNILMRAKLHGVEDKVLFLGAHSDIERYYFAMDVFCLTSFFESSSIVTAEAQFAGLKCVISNSIPDNVVITDKVNRLPLNAPIKEWVDAINDKLPHDKQVGKLSDFSLSQAALQLKHLYQGRA